MFFGLSTDPAVLPAALPAAGVLAAVGVVTKLGTGWYAGWRAGVSRPGRLRAGAVLVPRGEFSIVIATLAASAGVTGKLAPVAAAYVLLLGVVGPVLPRVLDVLGSRLGRRAAAGADGAADLPAVGDAQVREPA